MIEEDNDNEEDSNNEYDHNSQLESLSAQMCESIGQREKTIPWHTIVTELL